MEAHSETERELKHNGVIYQSQTWQDQNVESKDDFMTKELLGYSFLVRDPQPVHYMKELKLNTAWIFRELNERLGGEGLNPGEAYKDREGIWGEFLHDGKFSYTYSERIGTQIQEVISLLEEIPSSRHGIINIYNPEIDNSPERRRGSFRVPCSMYYNVFIREVNGEKKLHMIYNIRSNDFETHFPYDITLAVLIQQYIAHKLGIEPGDLIYQSGSLHVFKKDAKEIF